METLFDKLINKDLFEEYLIKHQATYSTLKESLKEKKYVSQLTIEESLSIVTMTGQTLDNIFEFFKS